MAAGSAHTITIPLRNQTGLNAQNYTIYILGFSSTSKKMLNVAAGTKAATFVPMPSENGTLPAYRLGVDIDQISFDVTPPNPPTKPFENKIDGARIYFFVAANAIFPKAPVVTYSGGGSSVVNVKNPPNSEVPPYTFAEFTVVNLNYGAVIDLQTVDGLTFPVNLTLNDSMGAVGQPLTAGMHRKAIFDAYKPFMKELGTQADPFIDLQYSENSGGLLNPGIFLTETNAKNELNNLKSPLNSYFDSELKSLFANRGLSIQGVAAGTIQADVYTVASIGEQSLPTPNRLSHLAIQFKGRKTGTDLKVFSPIGLCTLTFAKNGVQTAISGQLKDTTLTFDAPLPEETNIRNKMSLLPAFVVLDEVWQKIRQEGIIAMDLIDGPGTVRQPCRIIPRLCSGGSEPVLQIVASNPRLSQPAGFVELMSGRTTDCTVGARPERPINEFRK